MKYNGMELKEITEPQVFNPPKKMLVWDNDEKNKLVRIVAAILPGIEFPVATIEDGRIYRYGYCAEIPEAPKPRRATWLEVARWCATGNGLVYDTYRDNIDTGIMFKSFEGGEPIMDEIKVRKWDDTEWHEPTADYLGMEDNK